MVRVFRNVYTVVGVLATLVLAPGVSLASDGITELSQTAALNGELEGDDPDFPITITESGSYLLTSNLNVTVQQPVQNITAIEVEAGGVRIDLNGFAIIGPCTGVPCNAVGMGVGIHKTSPGSEISIVNGSIRGMASHGIKLTGQAHVENVRATENAGRGIFVSRGILIGNQAQENGNQSSGMNNEGIYCVADCIIRDNSVTANSGDGIFATESSIIGNVSNDNGGDGIDAARSTVLGNTAIDNQGNGLRLTSSGYGDNVLNGNGNGSVGDAVGGSSALQLGSNVCNTTICP